MISKTMKKCRNNVENGIVTSFLNRQRFHLIFQLLFNIYKDLRKTNVNSKNPNS